MPPGFYNPYDQQVYDAGFKYIPQSKYLINPFQIPTDDSTTPPNTGGTTNVDRGGGGGGYTGGITNLSTDYFNTIRDRQDRLKELNRPLQTEQFPSFKGARTSDLNGDPYGLPNVKGFSANEMYNRAAAAKAAGQDTMPSFAGITNVDEAMKYADDRIQDHKMRYATGQLGPNYIPAEKPTLNRRINDFIYGLPFTPDKPQTADQIIADGYTDKPSGGILGILSGMVDQYGSLPRGDQAFIARNMGYTGPTVFGANDSGLSKDIFGMNTRSGFGNYAEAVGKQVDKLGASLGIDGAIGGKKDFQGATFNPVTGEFESDELSPEQVAELNRRTKMVRAKYNFYTKQNKDYADTVNQAAQIQAAKDKDIVNKIGVTADDVASTTTQGGGGGIASSAYSGGGADAASMGGGSQQAKSSGGAKTGRTDGGWGLADGGRVYYMDGGLADMLEIYD